MSYKWYCNVCYRAVPGNQPYLKNVCPYCGKKEPIPAFPHK